MHDEGSLSKFECLVLVASAQMEDAGDWTCVISFLTSDGFKSMSKSIRIKVKGSVCYGFPVEFIKWSPSCAQQTPDAISLDIGGHLTTTDSGMSRGSSTSVDSLDEILRNLADVMATEPNRNDQQEQLSSPCYSVNYSSDSVSLAVKTKQSCMQYLNT